MLWSLLLACSSYRRAGHARLWNSLDCRSCGDDRVSVCRRYGLAAFVRQRESELGRNSALQVYWGSVAASHMHAKKEARTGTYARVVFGKNLSVSGMRNVCCLSSWVQQEGSGGTYKGGGCA